MTGDDVKRQVMAALAVERWYDMDRGGRYPVHEDVLAALAPCTVLTPEEAAQVRDHIERGSAPGWRKESCNCYDLLTGSGEGGSLPRPSDGFPNEVDPSPDEAGDE